MEDQFETKIATVEEFDAAHFIVQTDTKCRNIHGHRWKVLFEVSGTVKEDGMVLDFLKLKEYVQVLDHRLMVPEKNKMVNIEEEGENLRITVPGRFGLIIQKEAVILLPIEEVTAESLANYLAECVFEDFDLSVVKITVWESPKSYATAVRTRYGTFMISPNWGKVVFTVQGEQ